MLWQTRTIATFIAATIRTEDGKETEQMKAAKAIGKGVLYEGKTEDDEDDYYVTEEGYKHKFNSYEKVMDVFSGRGSVRTTRVG